MFQSQSQKKTIRVFERESGIVRIEEVEEEEDVERLRFGEVEVLDAREWRPSNLLKHLRNLKARREARD